MLYRCGGLWSYCRTTMVAESTVLMYRRGGLWSYCRTVIVAVSSLDVVQMWWALELWENNHGGCSVVILYNCGWFHVAVEQCVRGGGHCQRNPSVTLRLYWELTTSWSPTNSAAGSWSHRSWSVETCSRFCYIIIMMNFCRPPHLQMSPNCLATAVKDNRQLLLLIYNRIGWMHF